MSSELATIQPPIIDAITVARDPALIIDEARRAANALVAVLRRKPSKVMFNGEQYLENEDWQVIGQFFGLTARLESDAYVTYGDAAGWEATAVIVARDGRIVGRQTAMCLNDEEKWSARPRYVWAYCLGKGDHATHEHTQDDPGPAIVWERADGRARPRKWRMPMGTEPVPLFQLRSMAQTRASSRVHASVLRFVPVLAGPGYATTPAEEMDAAERVPQDAPIDEAPPPGDGDAPPGKTPTAPRPTPPAGYRLIDRCWTDGGWYHVQFNDPARQQYPERYQTKIPAIGEKLMHAFTNKRAVAFTSKPHERAGEPAWINRVEVEPDPPVDLKAAEAARDPSDNPPA